jgi:hypothetical protein
MSLLTPGEFDSIVPALTTGLLAASMGVVIDRMQDNDEWTPELDAFAHAIAAQCEDTMTRLGAELLLPLSE